MTPIDCKIQERIGIEAKKAYWLKSILQRITRWYERPVIVGALFLATFLPLNTSLSLYYLAVKFLAKNKNHRQATHTVKAIETLRKRYGYDG